MVDIDPDQIRASATRIRNFAEDEFTGLQVAIKQARSDLAAPVDFDGPIAQSATATMNALRKAAESGEANVAIIGDWLGRTPGMLTDFATSMQDSQDRNAESATNIRVAPPR